MFATIRRRILTGLLGALGAIGAGSPAWAQFSVSPVIVPLEPVAGRVSATVSVQNDGPEPLPFRFYAGDFDQEESGVHQYHEAGVLPHSCGDRFSVMPDGAILAPGEREEIVITMTPGSSTCWSGLFIETRDWGASGVTIGQRVMVKVYGVAPGALIDGSITSVSARANGAEVAVDVEFTNAGTRPLRPEGRIELRALTGEVLAAHAVEAFSALPGRRRRIELHLDSDLPPGRYVAVPVFDIGAPDLVGGQAMFRVPAGAGDG